MSSTSDPSRIIVIAGPKEGVGKTTLTLNLALAWASVQNRNVLIVPLDPLARQEHNSFFGVNPPAIADLMQTLGPKSLTLAGGLLHGRIPVSEKGVGILPVAYTREDVAKVSPRIIMALLSRLSKTFDIFIDVDSSFAMQTFAFDIADIVFWVTNSSRGNLNSTVGLFKEYQEMNFSLERFEVIVNKFDVPGSIDPAEIKKFFDQMGRKVLSFMPWQDSVSALSNKLMLDVVENPNSPWVDELRVVLGRLLRVEPIEKNWRATVSDEEFRRLALHWSKVPVAPSAGASAGAPAAGEDSGDIPVAGERTPAKSGLPAHWLELKQKTHQEVVKILEMERVRVSDDAARNQEIRKKVSEVIVSVLEKQQGLALSREQRTLFVNELIDDILGLGPLENLFRDKSVTEIMVNAPDKVFIEQKGKLTLTNYTFRDEDHIIQVIKRIVAPLGRRIDESVPLVDARLKDGSRVNAIIPPLAVSGPALTIRRFSDKPFGPEEYYKFGTITKPAMDFLRGCVLLKKDIIISGGTGTGKTTFLNALSSYIPDGERIITVEDTAELKLLKEHWIRLESKPANIEGKGEVTIRDLVKNCLRMRPDRIVVGEVRSSEALDMLQAMNTGHDGSLATIHANTPRDALTRLEAMCLMAGADLPIWALREMIASAVHLIVQLTRFADGTRKVTRISEVTGREDNNITMNDLFYFEQTGIDANGKITGEFLSTGITPNFFPQFAANGIDMPTGMFKNDKKPSSEAKG